MAWRKPTTVHEWMAILLRHKKKFVFLALLVAIVVVLGGGTIQPTFSAEGEFIRQNDPLQQQTSNPTIARNVEQIRRTYREALLGHRAVAQVIQDLNLVTLDMVQGRLTPEGERQLHQAVRQLQGNLSLRMNQAHVDYDQIEIRYTGTDRKNARLIVNRLIENYLAGTRENIERTLTDMSGFLEEEVERLRQRVRDRQMNLQNIQRRMPTNLPENAAELQNQIRALATREIAIETELAEAKANRTGLNEFIASASPNEEVRQTGRNPDYEVLQSRIGQLENEYRQRRASGMTDLHPTLVRLRANLESLHEQLARTPDQVELGVQTRPNPAWHSAQEELFRLNNQIKRLSEDFTRIAEERAGLERMDRNFVDLREQLARTRRELADAERDLASLEQAQLEQRHALNQTLVDRAIQLRFSRRAVDPTQPTTPNVQTILGAALALGLLIGAGLVLASEMTNRTFRSVEHATDELRLPVFGAVDQINSPTTVLRQRLLDWLVFPLAAFLMILVLLFCVVLTYSSLTMEGDQNFVAPLTMIRDFVGF